MTTDSTTTTVASTTTPAAESPEVAIQKTLGSLVEIGRVWANHGLGIGRSALDASRQSLELASKALTEVQSRLNPAPKTEA